jgi:hypothetical protein
LVPEFSPASRFIFLSFSPRPSGPRPKGSVTTSPVSFPPRLVAGALVASHGSFAQAITTIGLIYLVGLIVLIFARETKGQALPD